MLYVHIIAIQHALFKTACMGRSKVHTHVALIVAIDIFKVIGSYGYHGTESKRCSHEFLHKTV